MLEAIAAWKAGTWLGVLIFTSIAGGVLVKLFRPEGPAGRAAKQLIKRAEADEELQRELLTELKRLRADNEEFRKRLAELEHQQPLDADWQTQRRTEQRLRN